jgi:dipeptidyl aminopeptidase/acylaminoacyl peptidase
MTRDHDQPGFGNTLPKQPIALGRIPPLCLLALLCGCCFGGCGGRAPRAADSRDDALHEDSPRLVWSSVLPRHCAGGLRDFSPDCQQIVLTLGESRTTGAADEAISRLWIVGAAQPPRRVTDGRWDGTPQWSPSGNSIAYVSHPHPPPVQRPTGPQTAEDQLERYRWLATVVCVLDVAAGTVSSLELPEANYELIRWSPKGDLIACGSSDVVSKQAALESVGPLHLVIVDPGKHTAVAHAVGADVVSIDDLAWSPDGSTIAVDQHVLEAGQHVRRISLLDLTTGRLQAVHTTSGPRHWDQVVFDRRTDACSFTVFTKEKGETMGVLRAINTHGGEPTETARLAVGSPDALDVPLVAPDGAGLAALACQSRNLAVPGYLLWTHRGVGGSWELPRSFTCPMLIAWSPDSRRIAMAYGPMESRTIAVYELPVQP